MQFSFGRSHHEGSSGDKRRSVRSPVLCCVPDPQALEQVSAPRRGHRGTTRATFQKAAQWSSVWHSLPHVRRLPCAPMASCGSVKKPEVDFLLHFILLCVFSHLILSEETRRLGAAHPFLPHLALPCLSAGAFFPGCVIVLSSSLYHSLSFRDCCEGVVDATAFNVAKNFLRSDKPRLLATGGDSQRTCLGSPQTVEINTNCVSDEGTFFVYSYCLF